MARWWKDYVFVVFIWMHLDNFHFVAGKALKYSNSIRVPFTIPVNSHITTISPSCRLFTSNDQETSRLFSISSEGDLVNTKQLFQYLHKSFTLYFNEDQLSFTLQVIVDYEPIVFAFPQQIYHGRIKENLPPLSVIHIDGNLKIDDDSVKYSVLSEGKGLVRVHETENGNPSLISFCTFDREEWVEQIIILKAHSSGGKTTSATLKLSILDENDCIPKFSKKMYSKVISNSMPLGTEVLRVQATDGDIDQIKYYLSGTSAFSVNAKKGTIHIKAVHPGNHQFEVIATDSSGKQTFSKVSITVISNTLKFKPFHHLNKRQVLPRITTVERTVPIFENQTEGHVILSVAPDPRPSQGVEIYKKIGDSLDAFQVDTKGNVYLKNGHVLDYENLLHRNITLRFNITTTVSQDYQILTVHLDVRDSNDEKPVFRNSPRPFLATVSVDSSVGEPVYELFAEDPDTNSNIQYNLESAGEGKFTIENIDSELGRLGQIVTTVSGNGQFEEGQEFELVVSAQDLGAQGIQKSNFEIVRVLVGERPPQFYEDSYVAYITENNQAGYRLQRKDDTILKIEAKVFQSESEKDAVKFQLFDNYGQPSSVFFVNHKHEVQALQSLDFESSPHEYTLQIVATEKSRGHQSSAQLVVHLEDANDNHPIFELSTYTNVTSEGTRINTTLFSVTATDRDSGSNAQLTYTVNDDHFVVETRRDPVSGRYIGDLKVAKRLDYDYRPDRQYKFDVKATDHGNVPKSGQASVVLYVTNINDEPPEFGVAEDDVLSNVREDQKAGSYVTTVQAVDPDGDNVQYYFSPRQLLSANSLFRIEPNSGIITLTNSIPASVPSYTLNVTAYDDGTCCGGYPQLSSESFIIVRITDINNNNPVFPSCNYKPTVLENQPIGTSVVDVRAHDPDRGENGQITYSVVTPTYQQQVFDINPRNGTVVTNMVFNRESEAGLRGYPVTVKAEDNGKPQKLNTLCTFWVQIKDMNDNPPLFDSEIYTQTVVRSTTVNKRIMGVLAIDKDKEENAEVEYFLVDNPGEYFRMDQDTGGLYLDKTLSTISRNQPEIRLRVMAKDRGIPPLTSNATIVITLTAGDQKPPTWNDDYESRIYSVNETAPIGYPIATMGATSHVQSPWDGVSFALVDSNGNSQQIVENFRVDFRDNTVRLRVASQLDYNLKNSYTLRLRVTNQGETPLSNEVRLTISVLDMNNKHPQFEGLDPTMSNSYKGSVPENEDPGQTVITVKAVDPDHTPPNNVVSYSLVPDKNDAYKKFNVNPITGLITTNFTFDRETQRFYYINVMAKDGRPSDIPFHEPVGSPNSATVQVWVIISDKNDNTPFFEKLLYEEEVDEQPPDSSKTILTVKAIDVDTADTLTYTITSGNTGNVFGIKSKTGDIYVAKDLDFETPPNVYTLNVTVNDGYHINSTQVKITVRDINDNPPEFSQSEYIVTHVVEEQQPPVEGQFVVQVSATDKDTARQTNFRYSLNGENSENFMIDPRTGVITLHKSLDRDRPQGHAEYQFNVLVIDEPNTDRPLVGYAYVKVKPKDINDNTPEFTKDLTGEVPENSEKGKNVMTVRAIDYDSGENGTVYYTLGNNRPADPETGDSLFTIDTITGLIRSNTNKLDRETVEQYFLPVVATDRGVPPLSSTATFKIKVTDKNDEKPRFLQKIYRATLSESQKSGFIVSVSALDVDIGKNSKLTYSLESDLNFFSITTLPSNVGELNVFTPVDYEDPGQRFFNLTVKARDNNPLHEDEAYIEITVTDANDEPPKFTELVKTVEFHENIPEETLLYTFTANDRDSPPNDEFDFFIGEHSDRFYVEKEGKNKAHIRITSGLDGETLDRETKDQYTIKVLAIDKGSPPLTGTATLRINVLDLNDNPPTFAENYRPIIMEEEEPPMLVQVFSALDPDSLKFGPPFFFSLPPCSENPTCEKDDHKFLLSFNQAGAKGNGTGTVTAHKKFLREEQKYYYLPIVMKDSNRTGRYMSGTSTLTIEIGDKNNNQHVDGFKEIFVYNYKGMFGDVEIGRANANDPDDWDFVDKYYQMKEPWKTTMKNFFSVNEAKGMIKMKKGVPAGVFEFKVNVYDFKVFRQRNATATIRVTVKDISEEAVYRSGSVRLSGINAEEFVELKKTAYPRQSRYDKFRKLLSEKLMVDVENVEVFSVMQNGDFTDVRYAAHGSPWYSASKLDGIVAMYKEEFSAAAGARIAMVNIDECQKEICESGGCSNILIVDSEKPSMVNTKSNSFVGVGTKVHAECQCKARNFTKPPECTPDFCYNGGTCRKDEWGDVRCDCLPKFDGSRCQQTTHSFSGGYSLYPPLSQCEDSSTSVEFVTLKESGLIFYNGPIEKMEKNHPQDFISLSLIGGYPQLIVNHGSGQVTLQITGKDRGGITRMPALNDGSWHHIDIIRKGKNVQLIVDRCEASKFDSQSEIREDRNPCEVSGYTPGQNKYLNVNQMLQMGGRYISPKFPTKITKERFHGCIRNLYHNGELYDLYTSRGHPGENHRNACPEEESVCHSLYGNKCGEHGRCQMISFGHSEVECVCHPGYRPSLGSQKCDQKTTIRDFTESAFMTWNLKDQLFNELKKDRLNFQVRFRTRSDGVLLHLPSNSKEFITLQIRNSHIEVVYNLKDFDNALMEKSISLSFAVASNGQWHTVFVQRIGRWFQLTMDGGEGRYYNETWGSSFESQHFNLKRTEIVSGANIEFVSRNPTKITNKVYETCITDIRINNRWFSMQPSENIESDGAEVDLITNVDMDCIRDDCANVKCSDGSRIEHICVPLWGTHDCRCPVGSKPGKKKKCEQIYYCLGTNPCKAGGKCIDLDYPETFRCECPEGWEGPTCDRRPELSITEVEEVMSAGGITVEVIVIIIVSLAAVTMIAFLVFLLWRVVSKKERQKSILYDDQYDDIRENVVNHDEEGAGEEDQNCYDISQLRKPETSMDNGYYPSFKSARLYKKGVPVDSPEVGAFIEDRLQEFDDDPSAPPHDNVMVFSYEGGSSTGGSLSSLNTNSSDNDQDYDYLTDWGPKFNKLASMYNTKEEDL